MKKLSYRFSRYRFHLLLAVSSTLMMVLFSPLFVAGIPVRNNGTVNRGRILGLLDYSREPGTRAPNSQRSADVIVRDVGPEGGSSYAVAGFVFNRPDTRQILLPAPLRVFRSMDAGANWQASDIFPNAFDGTFFVRQDPHNPQILFAAKDFSSGPGQAGIYRSTDFGATWAQLPTPFFDAVDCSVHEASSNVVLVLTNDSGEAAMWRSEDGGITYEAQLASGLPHVIFDGETGDYTAIPAYSSMATTPADPNAVYAVMQFDEIGFYPPRIHKSVDGGLTFSPLENGPPQPLQVFPHPTNPEILYVQDQTFTADTTFIYRSLDGGDSFEPVTSGLPAGQLNFFVAFDAQNPSFVYIAGEGGFFRSTDNGETFEPLGLTPDQLSFGATTASVDPANSNVIYVNTDRGNFRSANGGVTFLPINNGWRAAGVRHIAFDNDTSPALYAAAVSGLGILKTKTRGKYYESIPHPPALYGATLLTIAPNDPRNIFATTSSRVFHSHDGGSTWTVASFNGNALFNQWSEIAIDPTNANNVYLAGGFFFGTQGFFRSTDGGSTFQQTFESRLSDLAIVPSNPNVIFAGSRIFPTVFDVPLKSTDGGVTFASGPIPRGDIREIVIDPSNPNNIYLSGFLSLTNDVRTRAVVRSTNGGLTYVGADNGLQDPIYPTGIPASHGMVMDPENPSRLYIWATSGLYGTRDGGATWSLLEADQSIKAYWWGNTIAINPKKPNLIYLAGSTILEFEVRP